MSLLLRSAFELFQGGASVLKSTRHKHGELWYNTCFLERNAPLNKGGRHGEIFPGQSEPRKRSPEGCASFVCNLQ